MTEIKVQTHVDLALQSGNRVDATAAKGMLQNILQGGVSPTELKDAEALSASAARSARAMEWEALAVFGHANPWRAADQDQRADRVLDRMSTAIHNATELKQFAQQLYQDLNAAHQEQSVVNKVTRFFAQTWDSIWT